MVKKFKPVNENTDNQLIHYALEDSRENNRFVVVCYYRNLPTEDQIRQDLVTNKSRFSLSCDVNDKHCNFKNSPTPVADLAKLSRIECHPSV